MADPSIPQHDDAPILFIHGLIGHMRAREISQAFGERAITPDLLGYGDHRDYRDEISLTSQIEFLRAILNVRGIARAHIAGHSIGGAIAMLFARAYPELTESVTSVEGNFTLKDAFWSSRIAESTIEDVQRQLDADRAHPERWLQASGVSPTPERVDAAISHLNNQDAHAIMAMAKSVVEITSRPKYLDDVMTVLNNGTRMHLIAGERSRPAWDVPEFVLDSAELTVLPGTGHLITIESPALFAEAVALRTS